MNTALRDYSPSSNGSQRALCGSLSNPTRDKGASKTSQVTDVLEAVQSFVAKGYDREYRVKDGNLVDLELGSTLDPCTRTHVDAALCLRKRE